MYIITLLVSILILVAFFEYLYALNPEKVQLYFTPGGHHAINSYLMIYIFAAFLIGILLVLFITLLKDLIFNIRNQFSKRSRFIKTEIDNSVNRAYDLYIKGQYGRAIDILKKYISKELSNKNAYLLLAKIYKHKENMKESEDNLNKVLQIEGDNIIALNEAGNLYKLNKDYDKAIHYFNKSLEYAKDNIYALSELKDLYIKKEEWKNAYRMSKLILSESKDKQFNKKEEEVMLGLKYEFGKYLLERENDTERSAKRFNQVLTQNKNFVPAYLTLGDVYIKKGKHQEAYDLWEKAFSRTGNFALIIKMEDFAIKTNHPENMIKFYQELIYDNPEKWEYRLFLSKLYIRLEMIDEAYSNLQTIPQSIFKDNSLNLLLAECYFKRGKFNDAAANFRNALKGQFPVKLPFTCSNCGFVSYTYFSICPSCNLWNTFNIKTGGTLYESGTVKGDWKNIPASISE